MTAPAVELGPPEPAQDAGPAELLDHAERLLELHDEQDRPAEAGAFWRRCRDTLLRARDLLEGRAAAADPAELARARYLLGLALSVGYWQAVRGNAEAYALQDLDGTRRSAASLLALARATLPADGPAYATACVRLGLLLHGRYEDTLDAEAAGAADAAPGPDPVTGSGARDDLDEALAAFDDGLPLLDEDPHPGLFTAYGCALADRYDLDPTPEGLRHAAAVLDSVLEELRPAGWEPSQDGAGSWADEADELETETRVRLIRLLQGSPEATDKELACEHLELLAATLPDEHEARIFAAGHLVDAYRERGEGRVRPEDRPAYLARLRDLRRLLDPANVYFARANALLGTALAERVDPAPPAARRPRRTRRRPGCCAKRSTASPRTTTCARPPTRSSAACSTRCANSTRRATTTTRRCAIWSEQPNSSPPTTRCAATCYSSSRTRPSSTTTRSPPTWQASTGRSRC